MARYENRLFSILGDSMSAFAYYIPYGYPSFYSRGNAYLSEVSSARETWWGMALHRLGGELLVNNSWAGSTVCRPPTAEIESYGCSDARCRSLGDEGKVPDVIWVFMGANDRGYRFSVEADGTDADDLTVFPNAYRVMLEKIRRAYPDAEVWCLNLPRPICTRDPSRSELAVLSEAWNEKYNRVIADVAAACGCRLMDLGSRAPVDTCDGLHPNAVGMRWIAEVVIEAMESSDDP